MTEVEPKYAESLPGGIAEEPTPVPCLPLEEAAAAALVALQEAINYQAGSVVPRRMLAQLPHGVYVAAAVLERALDDA